MKIVKQIFTGVIAIICVVAGLAFLTLPLTMQIREDAANSASANKEYNQAIEPYYTALTELSQKIVANNLHLRPNVSGKQFKLQALLMILKLTLSY